MKGYKDIIKLLREAKRDRRLIKEIKEFIKATSK